MVEGHSEQSQYRLTFWKFGHSKQMASHTAPGTTTTGNATSETSTTPTHPANKISTPSREIIPKAFLLGCAWRTDPIHAFRLTCTYIDNRRKRIRPFGVLGLPYLKIIRIDLGLLKKGFRTIRG